MQNCQSSLFDFRTYMFWTFNIFQQTITCIMKYMNIFKNVHEICMSDRMSSHLSSRLSGHVLIHVNVLVLSSKWYRFHGIIGIKKELCSIYNSFTVGLLCEVKIVIKITGIQNVNLLALSVSQKRNLECLFWV